MEEIKGEGFGEEEEETYREGSRVAEEGPSSPAMTTT